MRLCLLVSLLCVGLCLAGSRKRSRCPPDSATCSECVAAAKECVWCSAEDYSGPRCQHVGVMSNSGVCPKSDIVNLPHTRVTITKNLPIKGKRLIMPQRMRMSLRKGVHQGMSMRVLAKKSSLSLQLKHPRAVKVTVGSNCNGFQQKKKTVVCSGIEPGEVSFNFTVTLKRCLPKTKKVKIMVDGKKKKAMKISITSVCSCDCDKPENRIPATPQCSSSGDLACGQCSCSKGFYGKRCECSGDPAESMARCTASESSTPCSGRGDCVCGACQCRKISPSSVNVYSGQYCECDDFSCEYFNGQMCGGPSHGRCSCGICNCMPGYTGHACELSLATDRCVTFNGELCNGHGKCVGNQCVCDRLSGYMGPTCEDCPTCPGQCQQLKPCVQCSAFVSGPYTQEECQENCRRSTVRYETVDALRDEIGARNCRFRDEDDCMFYFSYGWDDDGRHFVLMQRTKLCP